MGEASEASEPAQDRSRAKPKPRPQAVRLHQLALATQFALGAYLWLVPDELFFLGTQLIVLAHVLSSLIWLPLFCKWLLDHVVRPGPRPLWRLTDRGRARALINAGFLLAVSLALLTGLWVLARSEGMPAAWAHTLTGVAVVVLLLIHYGVEARRHLTRTALALVGVAAVVIGLRLWSAAQPEPAPESSEGEAVLAPDAAYDSAAWCGSCHAEIYADWQTSAHGRAMIDRNILDELGEEAEARSMNVDGDLAFMHALAAGDEAAQAKLAGARFDPCVHCHAPTSFYGDSTQPILEATDSAADGITCAFCHTLGGVDDSGVADMSSERLHELAKSGAFSSPEKVNQLLAARMPRYESKPQRVRRYLFQNADNLAARTLGDLLIRWRPEVHRRDYRPKILSSSEACLACHGSGGQAEELFHQTYPDWADSRYAGVGGEDVVECQDCHMVRELTGEAHRDAGRLVDWGPTRPSQRNHLLLGGNLSHIDPEDYPDYAAAQRALRARALELSIDAVEPRAGSKLAVTVGLRNLAVGHDFPGRETPVRFAWVRVEARDAAGEVLASTPVFRGMPDKDDIPAQVIVYYRRVDNLRIAWDTAVKPDSSRADTVELELPAGAEVAEVVAELHSNTDPHAPAIVTRRSL